MANPDGTVQVVPPTRSAFAPQLGMPQAPPAAAPVPTFASGTPGVAGAIYDAIKAISDAVAPRSIVQRRQAIDQAVERADPSPGSVLGNVFHPQ